MCNQFGVNRVFIDVPEIGYQLSYYSNKGYKELGYIDTSKIHWELGPSILMSKSLEINNND